MTRGLSPAAYSKFGVHKIDDAALDKAEWSLPLPFNDDTVIRGYNAINQPNCQVVIEDFRPGDEFAWTFVHDEMQYCTQGEIELEVFLPPLYAESVKAHVTPGTILTFPIGARMHVKVLGDKPFRHICFCTPSPDYPFPSLDDLK